MNRVPCKICGAEILSATAVRNQGLCGRCAKGHRPCIYCGNFVSEPLRGGVYAHVECLMKNRQKESGHWHTIEDIDWQMVEGKIHDKLSGLFANPPNPIPKCELVFWIDTNGGLNFDVYQVSPAGHQVRFGNLVKGWIDDMGFFDESFDAFAEGLAEEGDFDAIAQIESKLRNIVRAKCRDLETKNFGYQNDVEVTWRIHDDTDGA